MVQVNDTPRHNTVDTPPTPPLLLTHTITKSPFYAMTFIPLLSSPYLKCVADMNGFLNTNPECVYRIMRTTYTRGVHLDGLRESHFKGQL